jgi:hypothetical protein
MLIFWWDDKIRRRFVIFHFGRRSNVPYDFVRRFSVNLPIACGSHLYRDTVSEDKNVNDAVSSLLWEILSVSGTWADMAKESP